MSLFGIQTSTWQVAVSFTVTLNVQLKTDFFNIFNDKTIARIKVFDTLKVCSEM